MRYTSLPALLSVALPVLALPEPGENYYTTNNGAPIRDPHARLTIGNQLHGPGLLRDINLIESISHITLERIPERVVHAKGASALGYFEVTHDITNYTSANFLNTVGKKTPLSVRFSTVAGGRGSADTVRDTRGFAFKMYTDEGNLDWMFFSHPVFPIRDPAKFPDFVHVQKGVPQNGLASGNAFWDFVNRNSEAYHLLIRLFTDTGTPQTYQNSEIHSINTYKFTKDDGSFSYIKVTLEPVLGIKNMNRTQAVMTAGQDPDFHSRALFDAIEAGGDQLPQWDVFAQIIPPSEAASYKYNIFDSTHVVDVEDYPRVPFGRITLDRNIQNFHTQNEQQAFSPTNIVPGWGLTQDPILQTRLFAYGSTQRYRVGVNHFQFPINRPKYLYQPTRRDGAASFLNLGSTPNYIPGSEAVRPIAPAAQYPADDSEIFNGPYTFFNSNVTAEDYEQPRAYYLALPDDQKAALPGNVAGSLSGATPEVRNAAYDVWAQIDQDLSDGIKSATEKAATMDRADTRNFLTTHYLT